jgi:hypothetical protein
MNFKSRRFASAYLQSQAFIERLVGGLGLDHSGRRRALGRVEAERIFTGAAHAGLMH